MAFLARALTIGSILLIVTIITGYAQAQMRHSASEPLTRGSFLGLRQALEIALQKHPILEEASASMKAGSAAWSRLH